MTLPSISDLDELELEYGLRIIFSRGCECSSYLRSRRGVLPREIVKVSIRQNRPPVQVFIEYLGKVHQRHEHSTET